MEPDGWAPILVQSTRKIAWEYVNDAGDTITMQRDLAFCTEHLICDWNASDGLMFAWPDVEQTIVRIAEKAGTLLQVTFSKFVRPDMIALLQQRGVPAMDLPWTDAHIAAAFRSFVALTRVGYCALQYHERARGQLRLIRNIAGTARRTGSRRDAARFPGTGLSHSPLVLWSLKAAGASGCGRLKLWSRGWQLKLPRR